MIDLSNNPKIEFGKGARIWLTICIVVNALSTVSRLFSLQLFSAIVSLAYTAALVWLLQKKQKMAFYALLGMAVVIMVINMVVYHLNIFSSLFGLIGPLIIYLFIRDQWGQME